MMTGKTVCRINCKTEEQNNLVHHSTLFLTANTANMLEE